MRLLTHNLLQCNKKGVNNGFPLIIKAQKLKYEETQFEKDFVVAMLPKLEWSAVLQAVNWLRECAQVENADALAASGGLPALPAALTQADEANEDLMKKLHLVLFDMHVIDGKLVCPESGREFPVENGIPNMLLNDDEV
eukprot:TRINITY_DN82846_c0_g1_i1.p2 TRINITY_DN82846_c0_g1~~TRINITY_DN82846_c0_g1_i1.p2  ORF type:complete len:139 (-),score=48.14 TRINITY_DN82846_c0_g1_i1:33-449(-)